MKYIINNSQVNSAIYKYINDLFIGDNLGWDYDINYDTDKPERDIINFYGEEYREGYQEEWYFQYIKKEWYEKSEGGNIKDYWLDKAPLLDVIDTEWQSKMTLLFDQYWVSIFEQWFKDKYPNFPVKTFLYQYRGIDK